MGRFTGVIRHLIIINFLVWIGILTIGNYGEPFQTWLSLHFPKSDSFGIWQVFSHMFMHATYVPNGSGGQSIYFQHILGNMFMLWMFGGTVEQALGKNKFLFFYISAGLGAALITMGVDYIQFVNTSASLSIDLSTDTLNQIVNLNSADGNYLRGDIFYKNLQPILQEYNLLVNEQDFGSLFRLNALTSKTMVGASGAMTGVLVAFGMLFPEAKLMLIFCLLYTSPSPRDLSTSRMPSSA